VSVGEPTREPTRVGEGVGESLPLRQFFFPVTLKMRKCFGFSGKLLLFMRYDLNVLVFVSGRGRYLPSEVTAGSRATDGRELRQARKGAAAAASAVCRGGAWLSLVPASRRLRFDPNLKLN